MDVDEWLGMVPHLQLAINLQFDCHTGSISNNNLALRGGKRAEVNDFIGPVYMYLRQLTVSILESAPCAGAWSSRCSEPTHTSPMHWAAVAARLTTSVLSPHCSTVENT